MSVDNFASLDTPGDPGGVKVVELSGIKPKSAYSVIMEGAELTDIKKFPINLYDCSIFLL